MTKQKTKAIKPRREPTSDQSGAPRIKVTPAMIEAGIDAIHRVCADISDTTPPKIIGSLVAEVFLAMTKELARSDDPTPRLPRTRGS